ncbi:hypothetical protein N8704_01305 [bacterium]|nr:hypothetical protein [bacterium]
MVLSTRSKTFQDTLLDVDEKITSQQIESRADLKNYLEEKDIDYADFLSANEKFRTQIESGEEDFVSRYGYGRAVGRAIGETAEGVTRFGEMIAPEAVENIFSQAAESLGEYIPDYVKEAASEFFDPYHGTGTGAAIEEGVGVLGSYLVPGMAGIKLVNAAGKSASAVKAASPGVRALVNGVANRISKEGIKRSEKVAGFIKPAVGFAGGATVVEDPKENLVNTMIEQFPESAEYLNRLAIDPNDSEAKQYTQAFINNLGLEAIATPIALGAFIATKAAVKGTGQLVGKAVPNTIKKNFTANLGTDDITGGLMVERSQATEAAVLRATSLADELEEAVIKEYKDPTNPELVEKLNTALETGSFGGLKPNTKKLLMEMRNNLDEVGSEVNKGTKGTYNATIAANLPGSDKKFGTYITRSYDFFDDPELKKNVRKAYSEYRQGNVNPKGDFFSDAISALQTQYDVTPAKAQDYLDELLGHGEFAIPDYDNQTMAGIVDSLVVKNRAFSNSKIGKARTNLPEDVRILLGEVKDPFRNYVKTYSNLAKVRAESKFLDEVAQNLINKGIAKTEKPVDGLNYYSLKDITEKRLGSIVGKDRAKEGFVNPLEELYVTQPYKEALEQGYDAVDITGPWMKNWMKAKGLSQTAKTIYSPTTHGRNIMGNFFFLGANGMLGPKGSLTALKTVSNNLLGLKSRDLQEKYARYVELGIANSGVKLGVLRNNLRAFDKGPTKWLDKTVETATGKGVKLLKQGDAGLKDLYQAEDDLFKIAHFEKSLDTVKKSKLYKDLPLEDQERIAAQRTRDLMPNYNLVPKAIKSLRGAAVGDFVSFPAELIRITKNLAKYTMEDLATGDATLMGAAAKRLGGMTAIGLGGDIASDYTKNIFGITEKQEKELDNVLAPWQARTDKLYLSPINKDKNNHTGVDFFNLGYIDPFTYLKTFSKGLHTAIAEGEDLSETEQQKLAFGLFEHALSPFLSPAMLTEGLKQGYDKMTSNDPVYRKAVLAGEAILKPFVPGFVTNINKALDYSKSKAKADEFGGEARKKGGSTLIPGEVDFLSSIGLKRERFDITNSVKYALKSPLIRSSGAGKDLTYELNTNYNLTEEDIPDIKQMYLDSQEYKLGAFQELKSLTDSYKEILGPDFGNEFYKAIDLAGFNPKQREDITSAARNTFQPYTFSPSKNITYESRPALPWDFFDAVNRELGGTKVEKK